VISDGGMHKSWELRARNSELRISQRGDHKSTGLGARSLEFRISDGGIHKSLDVLAGLSVGSRFDLRRAGQDY